MSKPESKWTFENIRLCDTNPLLKLSFDNNNVLIGL